MAGGPKKLHVSAATRPSATSSDSSTILKATGASAGTNFETHAPGSCTAMANYSPGTTAGGSPSRFRRDLHQCLALRSDTMAVAISFDDFEYRQRRTDGQDALHSATRACHRHEAEPDLYTPVIGIHGRSATASPWAATRRPMPAAMGFDQAVMPATSRLQGSCPATSPLQGHGTDASKFLRPWPGRRKVRMQACWRTGVVDPPPPGSRPDMRPLHGRWVLLEPVSAETTPGTFRLFDGSDDGMSGPIWAMGHGRVSSSSRPGSRSGRPRAIRGSMPSSAATRARPAAWAPSCAAMRRMA